MYIQKSLYRSHEFYVTWLVALLLSRESGALF